MTILSRKTSTIIFLSSMLSFNAMAAELEYEIRIGASRSDNVARTSTLEIEETIALAGLILDLQHESRRVAASLVTDLEYRNYTDDTFDDEVVGSLNADLELQLAPEVFSWIFQYQFGNLQTNPFEANTAFNRQNVNRFSTGPDLRMRLGSNTALELGGRYHSTRYEISDIDNDVFGGSISLVRALSTRRSLSLNITADRIEYDNTQLNSNYDRQTAFIGFESEGSRGSIVVNIGYNELHDNGEVVDGNLINVAWDREISPSTTFRLAYNQGLTNPEEILGQAPPGAGFDDPQNTPGVSDPFENRQFSMALNFDRNTNNVFASLLYNEDEYVTDSVLDRNRSEFRVGFSKILGSAWRIRLSGALQRTDFVSTGREDDDTVISAGISRQLSRTIGINLDYTRFDRDSSDSAFDYVENLVNLTFSYAYARQ